MCGDQGARVRSTGRIAMISLWQQSTDVLLVVCVLLEFFVVCVIQDLQLLLDGGALAAADGAAARMLLLLLHLAQDGLLFDLDERLALVLAEGQPELADALALLLRRRVPDAVLAGAGAHDGVGRGRGVARCGVGRVCEGRGGGHALLLARLLAAAAGEWRVAVGVGGLVVAVGAVGVLVVLDVVVRVEVGVVVVGRLVELGVGVLLGGQGGRVLGGLLRSLLLAALLLLAVDGAGVEGGAAGQRGGRGALGHGLGQDAGR